MERTGLRLLATAMACIGCASLAYAHPTLAFVEQIETQPAQGSKDKPKKDEFPLSVTLGHDYLTVEAKGTRTIYDFAHRRQYRVQLADKTYQDTSLYAILGFNAMELQNRLGINRMLAAAKINKGSQDPAVLEHVFALTIDGQNTVIDTTHAKGKTTYGVKGRELLSISDKTQPLPAGYQGEYLRWLHYAFGGHPKIYEDFAKHAGVPETLRTLRPTISDQFITLRLTSISNAADVPYSLEGFAPAERTKPPYPALKKIGSDPAAAFAASTATEKKDRDALLKQGKYLDAMLAHFAYALSAGDTGRDWLVQARSQMGDDPDARAFAASLQSQNPQQSMKALETLGVLRSKATSPYVYLLDVFAANHHGSLKHSTDAEKFFLDALASNPYLTGAWFDLGNLYYQTFRTEEAWACWDAARSINPHHPFGKQIDAMEKRMVADHPELF